MGRLLFGLAMVLLHTAGCEDERAGNGGGTGDGGPPSSCPAGLNAVGAACVPALDACPDDSVPVPGGGCQQVGVAACPGGLASPGGACTPVGSRATCPDGWARVSGGWCEPTLPASSCQGARTVVGQTSCQPIGDCGSDTYGNVKTTGQTVFVDKSYTGPSADGSQAKPYTSIGAALQAAPSGAQIAVAAGEYEEDLVLAKPTTLDGRCAGMVTIKGVSNAAKSAALRVTGTGSTVRGVTVTGPGTGVQVIGSAALEQVVVSGCGQYGVLALAKSTLTVKDSLVAGNTSAGISLEESSGTLEGVEVRDTLEDGWGQRGFGVEATFMTGRQLEVRDSVIAGNRRSGVFVHGGDTTIENSVVKGTRFEPKSKMYGTGVKVIQEAKGATPTLSMKDCLVAESRTVGVVASGAAATLEGVVVRDTRPRELDGKLGTGVLAILDQTFKGRARLELRASLIARSHNDGAAAEGSELTMEGTEIRETRASPAEPGVGYGVQVSPLGGPSKLTMTNCLVEKNRGVGVLVVDSSASLSRVMVRATEPRGSDGQLGVGVQAYRDQAPTELSLRDCTLTGNHSAALHLLGVKAELEGVVLEGTDGDRKGLYGFGLEAGVSSRQPSTVTMSRCAVARNRAAGLALFGSSATLSGCSIKATGSQAADRTLGMGIVAQRDDAPARLSVTDSRVAGNRTAGVTVWESAATIERCVVSATRRQERDDRHFGDGIVVFGDDHPAELTLSNSLVEHSARANLLFVDRAGGAVDGSAFTDAEHAVVLVGAASPRMGSDNAYHDNQDDRVSHEESWQTAIPPVALPAL